MTALSPDARAHAARVVIASAMVLAGWHFGLRRTAAAATAAKASLAASQADIDGYAATVAMQPLTPEEQLDKVRADADTVRAYWSRAGEGRVLYDRFGLIAGKVGVRLVSVEPRRVQPPRSTIPAEGPGSQALVSAVGYQLDVTGDYAAVADFLRALEMDLGMSRVESFRLLPNTGGDGPIKASISTLHPKVEKALNLFESDNPAADAGPTKAAPKKPKKKAGKA